MTNRQFWNTLITGIHARATYETDEWVSWEDAGRQHYGSKTYDVLHYYYRVVVSRSEGE